MFTAVARAQPTAAGDLATAQQLAASNRLVPGEWPNDTIREIMVAGDGMTETERRWAVEMPQDIELGVPPKRLQDSQGKVTPASMQQLRSLELAAVAEERYEGAIYLQRLQRVLNPDKTPLTYDDCAPDSPDEAAQFFLDNGCAQAASQQRVCSLLALGYIYQRGIPLLFTATLNATGLSSSVAQCPPSAWRVFRPGGSGSLALHGWRGRSTVATAPGSHGTTTSTWRRASRRSRASGTGSPTRICSQSTQGLQPREPLSLRWTRPSWVRPRLSLL